MDAKWWDKYRGFIASSSMYPSVPQPQPMLQTNNMNPDLVNRNNLAPPTNPNQQFIIVEEDSHGSTEPQERSSEGSQTASSRRRPRGRPRGSKNKAKPAPVAIETESPYALKSLVLEFTEGSDIVDTLKTYAYENHCGVVVLYCAGSVKDVIIRNGAAPSGVICLRGNHQILSIHGAILPTPSLPEANGLSIMIADEHGKLLGGSIRRRLVASGPVKMVAATFTNATFLRLPNRIPGDATATSSSTSATPAPPSGATQGPSN